MEQDTAELCLRRRGAKAANKRPAPQGRKREPVSRQVKLLIFAILLAPFAIFATIQSARVAPWAESSSSADAADPAVQPMERFLERYGVEAARITRIAQALVASGRKHKVDPKLLGSVLIVESRGDPRAISSAHAVGIMQIHVPTWGDDADNQGINLFKVEDNIDMGARILHGYIEESGLWEGVMRYHGYAAGDAASVDTAKNYKNLVRQLFES